LVKAFAVIAHGVAFFAGFFLYIGASDLLPEARAHDSKRGGGRDEV